ncbi:MAG: GatB/YqeY domain-containing protein [Chloroflexi bacterium]|nr:GatB/YqeY domain-containing protein [Chloroflexota bacterium]
MALQEILIEDMKYAMKNGDKAAVMLIRSLRAAIKNAEIEKQKTFTDEDIYPVIAKAIKQRKESVEMFKAGGRQDLVDNEENEIALLQKYLPAQMSKEEVIVVISRIIATSGAQSIKDKGKVMPQAIAELKGKADGTLINQVVTELLN